MNGKSQYEIIQDTVNKLRNGASYLAAKRNLTEGGIGEEEAEKILDRLVKQVEEEENGTDEE